MHVDNASLLSGRPSGRFCKKVLNWSALQEITAIKGEDMDACLEQVNKDSKVWQHGSMVAIDWFRIFSNHENLSKVCYSESVKYHYQL